jgi:hypothetical protein
MTRLAVEMVVMFVGLVMEMVVDIAVVVVMIVANGS